MGGGIQMLRIWHLVVVIYLTIVGFYVGKHLFRNVETYGLLVNASTWIFVLHILVFGWLIVYFGLKIIRGVKVTIGG